MQSALSGTPQRRNDRSGRRRRRRRSGCAAPRPIHSGCVLRSFCVVQMHRREVRGRSEVNAALAPDIQLVALAGFLEALLKELLRHGDRHGPARRGRSRPRGARVIHVNEDDLFAGETATFGGAIRKEGTSGSRTPRAGLRAADRTRAALSCRRAFGCPGVQPCCHRPRPIVGGETALHVTAISRFQPMWASPLQSAGPSHYWNAGQLRPKRYAPKRAAHRHVPHEGRARRCKRGFRGPPA